MEKNVTVKLGACRCGAHVAAVGTRGVTDFSLGIIRKAH